MEENIYLHFLNLADGIGPIRVEKLLMYFKNFRSIYEASRSDLHDAGLNSKDVKSILLAKEKVDLNEEKEIIEKLGVKLINFKAPNFPASLKEIAACPFLLYYFGNLEKDCTRNLAVVGTRRCSTYGRKITIDLVKSAVEKKLTIVSGLAYGIDAIAHQTALDNRGQTLAVIGSGLAHIYPKCNRGIAKKILETGGALISEFPPSFEARPEYFPRRNRIVAGLSKAVLVTEAPEKSGALITAFLALEQNREVLAVPGNIDSKNSIGTNRLLRLGAKAVLNAEDLLEEFGYDRRQKKSPGKPTYEAQNEIEKKILDTLRQKSSLYAEEIRKATKLGVSVVNQTLSYLEIRGVIEREPSGRFYLG